MLSRVPHNKNYYFYGVILSFGMRYRRMLYRSFSLLTYLLFSRHKRGHGIHSPFVYEFITRVLRNKPLPPELERIERIRTALLQSNEFIWVDDFGSGGQGNAQEKKAVSRIAATASTRCKYGRLLYRISRHYKPKKILELGTSLGLGSMYLGMASPDSEILTVDGCEACSRIAAGNFRELGLDNIRIWKGTFDNILPELLKKLSWIDLVYFDGDHRKDRLLHYFETALPYTRNESVFIVDDIHWSADMEVAWEQIKKHPKVKATVDLFQMGIVFFKKELQKQNFLVRFL